MTPNDQLQVWAERVARANYTSALIVLEQWKGYCLNCQAFDQSPTQEEFCRWYRLEMPWFELEIFEL
jgi:hypothetical protein